MPSADFSLRWESTKDQWWYASPIDCAAANGHYDLVKELLNLDSNHLIKLTSLHRIRRLETVWDDEDQFNDVAKHRSQVARKLYLDCESKKGRNSLIEAGYGGWLLYTAASAGDLNFVQELLQRDPMMVFGEREYGVTDIFYAAARSKNSKVFRLLVDFAVSPRFSAGKGEEQNVDIPSEFKLEMMNRAAHASARGGNLEILKELLEECTDVLAYRDMQGSTLLHAAACKGQVEVLKYLLASYDIISSTDNQGNKALHLAAYKGQLAAVENLILASPLSVFSRNKAGESFLHMAVLGFQSTGFQRLDRQIELMKWLMCCEAFNIGDIINAKDNDGRTALHKAITGDIHPDLLKVLMSVPSIDLNIQDEDGMTALDILRQRPHSVSANVLIRQLVLAGGISIHQDYTTTREIASQLKRQSNACSPGTSFRISDAEILLFTGIDNASDSSPSHNGRRCSSFSKEPSHSNNRDDDTASSALRIDGSSDAKKGYSVYYAAQCLKNVFQRDRLKAKQRNKSKNVAEGCLNGPNAMQSTSDISPIPLRQRFSRVSSLAKNKRILSVKNNHSTIPSKKKYASALMQGVMQAMPHLTISGDSPINYLPKSSFSSSKHLDEKEGLHAGNGDTKQSPLNPPQFDETIPKITGRKSSLNKSLRMCFGAPEISVTARCYQAAEL